VVEVLLPARPSRCMVEWGSDAALTQLEHQLEVFLDVHGLEDPGEEAKRRLSNLGYAIDMTRPIEEQSEVIRQFQRATHSRYALDITAVLDEPTLNAIIDSHDRCDPVSLLLSDDHMHEDDHLDDLDHDFDEDEDEDEDEDSA
jgi:hypothetical protein